ncbi:uncharacterized protein L969DRAFT_86153 [Mixia osmundae IAM 14324]|uniref:uncharacterized protein n=1 Tax=Mixia osmundae (strain CBS 9802 / IAM 14324 / JCM 22182 / KY 12970) TaxID=764103 RepID=UPI0004A54A2F|nr:uncharacterized protein L969DRAFT_86153 [Mixia osmundae IAM 14324]KEI40908.1 hypothetical protein L969DRAFT_86153 [Mixia osmundae IAM 14324]
MVKTAPRLVFRAEVFARHSDMSRCLLFSFEGSGEGMLGIRFKTVEELLVRHCGRELLPDTRQARRSLAVLYRLDVHAWLSTFALVSMPSECFTACSSERLLTLTACRSRVSIGV